MGGSALRGFVVGYGDVVLLDVGADVAVGERGVGDCRGGEGECSYEAAERVDVHLGCGAGTE